jgi:hypothetical protein
MFGAAAGIFAVLGSATLAVLFSVFALVAAGFAIYRVNQLGKVVEGQADRQSRAIDAAVPQVGGKDAGGSG